jgi:hypothetical protein
MARKSPKMTKKDREMMMEHEMSEMKSGEYEMHKKGKKNGKSKGSCK